jgi:CheY-like chemotaxis protein
VPLALAGDRSYPRPPEGTRAVLVDDDDTRRELLAAELSAWGLRVRAQSGTSRALAIQGTTADVIKLGPVVSVTRILASVIPALRPVPRKHSEPRGIPRVGSVRRKVLVADDDPANRRLLSGFLAALGCDADVVEDGVAAVEATMRGGYAAVLLDWQMPRIDGLAAAREIRFQEAARGVHTPLIAVTASAMPGDRERCLAAGIDDYLSKPIQLGELDRVLGRWLLDGPGAAEPQPEVVDLQVLAELRRVTRSGALLLDELIDVYVAEGRRRLASLSAHLARGDLRLAGRDAHALKGSSANLGVGQVRALAGAFEQQAAAGKAEGLGEAAARLAAAFEAAAARLAAERSPRG